MNCFQLAFLSVEFVIYIVSVVPLLFIVHQYYNQAKTSETENCSKNVSAKNMAPNVSQLILRYPF